MTTRPGQAGPGPARSPGAAAAQLRSTGVPGRDSDGSSLAATPANYFLPAIFFAGELGPELGKDYAPGRQPEGYRPNFKRHDAASRLGDSAVQGRSIGPQPGGRPIMSQSVRRPGPWNRQSPGRVRSNCGIGCRATWQRPAETGKLVP